MKIAIIGSGNVGGALAHRFIEIGHTVLLGAKFPLSAKSIKLAASVGEDRFTTVESAAAQCDVIVMTTPASAIIEVTKRLGDTSGKVIIDTMNIGRAIGLVGFENTSALMLSLFRRFVGGQPPKFNNTTDVILANTATRDVVKCFNGTGFENMLNPVFGDQAADMFMAGNSTKGKAIASQLAKGIGFAECYDLGGNDKFALLEQLALTWMTLAISQGHGRGMAMKIIKR